MALSSRDSNSAGASQANLPGPQHPLPSFLGVILRLGITGLFAVVPRLFVDLEVRGLDYDACTPATYFAISHKRDLDSIAPLPALLAHGGPRRLARDLHFAMRADGFEPGFLSRTVRSPAWLSRALHALAVGPVLWLVGDHPLVGFQARPAESWLRDVLRAEGDLRAGDVLALDALLALADAIGEPAERLQERHLSQLLAWRYTSSLPLLCGPAFLADDVRRRAERRAIDAAKAALADVADWLARGGSVYSAPEGRFTPDGKLSPITSGFHRLLRAAPVQTRVVPIALTYDFMTTGRAFGRMCMFVDLAPAITDAPALPRRELDARLRDGWLRAARFTMTQIGAGFLVERGQSEDPTFALDELVAAVEREARALAEIGRHVDARLLTPNGPRHLAECFLAFCVHHGAALPQAGDRWRAVPGTLEIVVEPGEVGYPRHPLAYAYNEYRDLLSLEQAASCEESSREESSREESSREELPGAHMPSRDQLGA